MERDVTGEEEVTAAVDFLAAPEGFTPARVLGVGPTPSGAVVMLGAIDRGMLLPIFISPGQALTIELRLDGEEFARPLTHDLLEEILGRLGGTIGKVQIDGLEGTTFHATIFVVTAEGVVEIDARPSDAIALAAGREIPIFISEEVLEKSGLTEDDIHEMRPPEAEDETPTMYL